MVAAGQHILAVDIGTSAIRAALLTREGDVIATHSVQTPIERLGPGAATLDPERCWRLTTHVVGAVVSGSDVSAVGVSAQLGMVLVDGRGDAVTPVYLWSDVTAEPYVDDVRDQLGEELSALTGRRPAAELTAVRLRMLASEEPSLLARAAAVLSLKDYLVARLTGELVTDPTHASYTMLYDVVRRAWSAPIVERLALPSAVLPPVRAAADAAGTLTRTAAGECGIEPGATVAVGGPDGTVGALGAGATEPGRTADIAGSTDVLVHVVDRPLLDASHVVSTNAYLIGDLWTIGGPTGLTGGAVTWLAELFGYHDVAAMYDELAPAMRAVPVGARGVIVDPALTGHRFPHWDLDRNGAIRGLSQACGRAELLCATHEGAAFLVGDGLSAIRAAGGISDSVIVVGGVARRPESLQLRASAWGVVVEGVGDGMATSRGAAILAGVAGGLYASVGESADHLVRPGVRYEPDQRQQRELAVAYASWSAAFGR